MSLLGKQGRDSINKCIDIIKSLGFDLEDKDNHFINILFKINQKPGIIKFLIER